MTKPRQRVKRPQERHQAKSAKPKKTFNSEKEDKPQYSTNICGVLFVFLIAFLVGLLALGYFRSPITAMEIDDISPVAEYERNSKLTKGEINKEVLAGESIEEDAAGNLYTGQLDGKVIRIEPSADGKVGFGKITTIAEIKIEDAEAKEMERNNGRPLGLRLMGNTLYGADAHFGIFKINVETSQLTKLVAMDDPHPPIMFPDDLSVTADERKVYFTDASTTYPIEKLIYMSLQGLCDGRVFEYDTQTKKLTAVLSGLCFPNGVQFTKDEKHLIVAETFGSRLSVYNIETWERTRVIRLPVMPDNIRASSKGTYWVAGTNPRTQMNVWFDKYPVVRQIIAGLFSVNQLMKSIPKFCMAIEVSETGEILQTLQDPAGKLVSGLAQVTELKDGRLALGSYFAPWMAFLNPTDSKPVGVNL